jgi:aspartate-semialdehyde dehydrogenase
VIDTSSGVSRARRCASGGGGRQSRRLGGRRGAGLIALPGSASVALATALAPLHALAGLKRVEVATYQAVSGSGRAAMDELAGETVAMLSGKKARGRAFGRQIAFNVIPQVDALEADGVSREERRLWEETRRVLGLPDLAINATAVRVPVFFGHSLAVHASFERPIERGRGRDGVATRHGIASSTRSRPLNFRRRPPWPWRPIRYM